MGTFRVAVDIGRPPPEVFGFLAEPRNMPQWYEAVERAIETTDGPVGPGARYDVVRSLPGGQTHNDVEVTEYELDRRFTLESVRGPTPFRYRYTLAPAGHGTRLTLDGRISGAGLPGPMSRLDGVATRLFKQGMRQNLNRLKRLVERPG